MFVREFYDNPAWHRKRQDRIRQAGGRCERCGGSGRLDLHHTDRYESFMEFMTVGTVLLCFACHQAVHSPGRERRMEARLSAMEVSDYDCEDTT